VYSLSFSVHLVFFSRWIALGGGSVVCSLAFIEGGRGLLSLVVNSVGVLFFWP